MTSRTPASVRRSDRCRGSCHTDIAKAGSSAARRCSVPGLRLSYFLRALCVCVELQLSSPGTELETFIKEEGSCFSPLISERNASRLFSERLKIREIRHLAAWTFRRLFFLKPVD